MKPLLKVAVLAFVLLTLVALPASFALAQSGNVFTDPPKTFSLTQGWYQHRQTFYYDFGSHSPSLDNARTVRPAPIYALITGFDDKGNPQFVPGQRNIIDVVPGDPGYSDLWAVVFVIVPPTYVPNTLKSAEDVRASGYPTQAPGLFVNCPVVPLNSTLAEGDPRITRGWYKGREAHYFDFGFNTDQTAPIYAFITGFDASGNPRFVEGQHNVIGVIPGDAGYSAFWDVYLVKVPASYQANSITSVDQVLQSGYEIVHPGIVVNCPVVRTSPPPTLCPRVSIPDVVIHDAMANPQNYYGWNLCDNPAVPCGPANPLRTTLSLRNPNIAYHPDYNPPVWKAGCS